MLVASTLKGEQIGVIAQGKEGSGERNRRLGACVGCARKEPDASGASPRIKYRLKETASGSGTSAEPAFDCLGQRSRYHH